MICKTSIFENNYSEPYNYVVKIDINFTYPKEEREKFVESLKEFCKISFKQRSYYRNYHKINSKFSLNFKQVFCIVYRFKTKEEQMLMLLKC
jgi:hypothetical protein